MAAGDYLGSFNSQQPDAQALFGSRVAVEGDLVVVGASYNTPNIAPSGQIEVVRVSTGELVSNLKPISSGSVIGNAFAIHNGYVAAAGAVTNYGYTGLYDALTGNFLKSFPTSNSQAVALSNTQLAATFNDLNQHVGVFDLATGNLQFDLHSPQYGQFGSAVAISESHIFVGAPVDPSQVTNGGAVQVFSTATGAFEYTIWPPTAIRGLNFGKSLAIAEDRLVVGAVNNAYLYNANSGTHVATLDDGVAVASYFGASVATDGTSILVGTPEISVTRFEASTGTRQQTYANPAKGSANGFATSVAIAAGSPVVGVPKADVQGRQDTGEVLILDRQTGDALFSIVNQVPHGAGAYGVITSVSGDSLLVVDTSARINYGVVTSRVFQYELLSKKLVRAFETVAIPGKGTRLITTAQLSGNYLIVGICDENYQNREIAVLDSASGEFLKLIAKPTTLTGAFTIRSAEGNRLVAGVDNPVPTGSIYIFDLPSGALVRTIDNPYPNPDGYTGSYFGNRLRISGDKIVTDATYLPINGRPEHRVYLIDSTTGQLLSTLQGGMQTLGGIFDLSDKYVAVSTTRHVPNMNDEIGVAIFDAATGQQIRYVPISNQEVLASIHLSGSHFSVSYRGRLPVSIYDIPTGQLRAEIFSPEPQAGLAFGYSASLNDRYLIVGAPIPDRTVTNPGKVYVYDGDWNDSSFLTGGGSLTYAEGATQLFISPTATAFDYDSANYAGGKLVINVATGSSTEDRLNIVSAGMSVGQVGKSGDQVFFGGVNVATLVVSNQGRILTLKLNDQATPAAVQAIMRRTTFFVSGNDPTPDTRTVTFSLSESDGMPSNVVTATIAVIPFSLNPVLQFSSAPRGYIENAAPLIIDPKARVTDQDSLHFATGRLILSSPQSTTDDRYSVLNQGTGTGQIGFFGNTVSFGGAEIGTVSGGLGTSPLVIQFTTTGATPDAVSALLRSLTIAVVGDNPGAASRNFTINITDGDGGTSNTTSSAIFVYPVNDRLQINLPTTLSTYVEDAPPVAIAFDATVADADVSDFIKGSLQINIAAGAQPGDRLSLRSASSGGNDVAIQDRNVVFNSVVVGQIVGALVGPSLTISLNASATLPAIQSLIRHVQFSTPSQSPVPDPRTVSFLLKDSRGLNFSAQTFVAVRAMVELPNFNVGTERLQYAENSPPMILAPRATLSDADSANFGGGRLDILDFADDPTLKITIRNQGMNEWQIGVVDNRVYYSGVDIASFTSDRYGIVVNFSTNATTAAVQALLRNIQYHTSMEFPYTLYRIVHWQLNAGGEGAVAAETFLNLTPMIDPPYLAAGGSVGYARDSSAIYLVAGATVTDKDSPTMPGGVLTVHIADGADDSNRLDVGGAFTISGNAIYLSNQVIGFVNDNGGVGTTDLAISFTHSATVSIVQQLMRSIRFRTIGGTSTAPRTVSFTLTDGAGGTSNTVAKTVNVTN